MHCPFLRPSRRVALSVVCACRPVRLLCCCCCCCEFHRRCPSESPSCAQAGKQTPPLTAPLVDAHKQTRSTSSAHISHAIRLQHDSGIASRQPPHRSRTRRSTSHSGLPLSLLRRAMGAKGSRPSIPSRFRASDFHFGESATIGFPAPPTAMAVWEPQASANGTGATSSGGNKGAAAAGSNSGSRGASNGRLLAVGDSSGSIFVFGTAGVHVKLFESPERAVAESAAQRPNPLPPSERDTVLSLSFLSSQVLLSVHPLAVKLWSMATMMEMFAIHALDLPPTQGSPAQPQQTHYQFTCAAVATEMDSRFVWLGTTQGVVLLFDSQQRRLSSYIVPLLPEAQNLAAGGKADAAASHAAALAASASGLLPPTSVTCLAQLPTDSSQLLIGYANDTVISWHISTRKLHRANKRSGCGGVTALCWETGAPGAHASTADHFAVGHRNGLIFVWTRKNPHAPAASLYLSNAPGPRAPITRLRWSSRSRGFFVCGGHLLSGTAGGAAAGSSAAAGAAGSPSPAVADQPVDSGCVVFVSGLKFDQRKICASSSEARDPASGQPLSAHGIKDFVQVLMTSPAAASAPATPGGAQAAPKVTPAFICVLASGVVSVFFPSIVPAVPPLPLTDLHDCPADSVQLLSSSSSASAMGASNGAAGIQSLRSFLADLRRVGPPFQLWTSLVRASLAKQHLWPLTGGCSSEEMAAREREEDALFGKLQIVGGPAGAAAVPAPAPSSDPTPLPALLVTTHSGAAASLRLYDATSPFEVELLAVLPLTKVLPIGARVTAAAVCVARRELLVGTSGGEIIICRLQPTAASVIVTPPVDAAAAAATASAAPSAVSAPAAASAPAAVPSPKAAAPASASSPTDSAAASAAPAASSSTATAPPSEFSLDVVCRVPFFGSPIQRIIYSPEACKYFVSDEDAGFSFLRPPPPPQQQPAQQPEVSVSVVRQCLPVKISAVHFSSEPLILPGKGAQSLCTSLFLYVCGVDGSLHAWDVQLEAKVFSVPSLVAAAGAQDDRASDPISFMETVSISCEPAAAVGVSGKNAQAVASPAPEIRQYVLCCTSQSIKLLTAGPKLPESLLSLRVGERIRLAFLVASPHLIAQRDEPSASPSPPPTAGAGSSPSPPPPSAPASELCLAIVDDRATLSVFSVNLKCLFTASLSIPARRLSPSNFSMSADGRMVFLPSAASSGGGGGALVLAQMFPNKCYDFMAPPAQLLPPASVEELERAAARCTQNSAAGSASASAAPAKSWFASILPAAASHDSLFAPPLWTEAEIDAAASRAQGIAQEEEEDDSASSASSSAAPAPSAGQSAREQLDREHAARRAASGPSASVDQASSARTQVASAQNQMAINKDVRAHTQHT